MPVVIVKTAIPLAEYERFKQKAADLKLSEYALAQEAIIVFINEPQKAQAKAMMLKLMDFFKEDLRNTGR